MPKLLECARCGELGRPHDPKIGVLDYMCETCTKEHIYHGDYYEEEQTFSIFGNHYRYYDTLEPELKFCKRHGLKYGDYSSPKAIRAAVNS